MIVIWDVVETTISGLNVSFNAISKTGQKQFATKKKSVTLQFQIRNFTDFRLLVINLKDNSMENCLVKRSRSKEMAPITARNGIHDLHLSRQNAINKLYVL